MLFPPNPNPNSPRSHVGQPPTNSPLRTLSKTTKSGCPNSVSPASTAATSDESYRISRANDVKLSYSSSRRRCRIRRIDDDDSDDGVGDVGSSEVEET